jgi:hypothetical protein
MQLGAFFIFPFGCCKQLNVVQKGKIMTHTHTQRQRHHNRLIFFKLE